MNTSSEPTFISLTPNFRVSRCDDRNLEVEEYREVVSRPNRYIKEETRGNKWVSVGFYSNLHQAVNGVLKIEEANITSAQRMDLESAMNRLQSISEQLQKSVRECGISVTDFVKKVDNRGKKPAKSESEVVVAKVKKTQPTVSAAPVKRGRGRPKKVARR